MTNYFLNNFDNITFDDNSFDNNTIHPSIGNRHIFISDLEKGSLTTIHTSDYFSYNGENGISASRSGNFTDNIISYNTQDGIYVTGRYNRFILNHIFGNGRAGVYIDMEYTSFYENFIYNNTYGVIINRCDSNSILDSLISNNTIYGVAIYGSVNNEILYNNFSNNLVCNGYDEGSNMWDDFVIGNRWDDYSGKDTDDNGIGDTVYPISGGTNQDTRPIYWDPPVINISSPLNYTLYGKDAPSFSGFIWEGVADTQWYTLGTNPEKYNFTGIFFVDTINQTGWDAFGNGTVLIHFFVNDSRGYIDQKDIIVRKDIIGPNITIINPIENKVYNATAPDFEIIINGLNIDESWYRLWNGTHWSINYTIGGTGSQRSGQIDQNAWNDCPNGTVTIEFYANDTENNIGMNSTTIRKDILGPLITINDPTPNELFSSTAPSLADCDVIFSDVSGIADKWYMLINGTDNTDFTNNYSWNDEVDQFVWDYMDNGTVIIRIFANDSLGYVGSAEVTVIKDIVEPIISITKPAFNDIFGNNTMNFTISVSGDDLDTIWYMLINGTDSNDYTSNFTYSETVSAGSIEDTIQYSLWNQFENGTVIIRFFLNRTNGLMTSDEVLVRKDIITPEITIIEPDYYELFNATAPSYNLIFTETNLDDIWYRLWNGTDWSINYTIGGTGFQRSGQINQNAWNDCPNGTVLIEFYANDTANNIGMNSTTIRKDIIGPQITIINPASNALFSIDAPDNTDCNVLFEDGSGVIARWYMLINGTDNTDYTDNYTWNGEVDQSVWNQMGNGTVTIRIFANDSVGNIGMNSTTIRKDIIFPTIVIDDPNLNDIFSDDTFNFTITVSGKNLDTIWYMLINGTNNNDYTNNLTYSETVSAGSIEDTINYNLWDQFENGTVIIRFFLNRTIGLMAFDDIIVRKDIIAPEIIIIEPIVNQSAYSTPPAFIITVIETNNHTKWYRLFNGTDYTENRTFISNGRINDTDWDAMWIFIDFGEMIWIFFYCNDTAGNL
ncbi:MAG: hypothetical protein EU529_10300, partial [Promethearchaeota archaeon]